MSKIDSTLKRRLEFYKEHYLSVSATIFFVFTAICYFHSDRYFSEFDIDFFMFGGFRDVYQVALSNSVLGMILVVMSQIFIAMDIMFSCKKEDSRMVSILKKVFGGLIFTFALYLLFYLFFLGGPRLSAEQLKSGLSERYNLDTASGKLNCQAIVGSTSEYLVTWDYFSGKSTIILRSTIVRLEMIVGTPPNTTPKPNKFSIFRSNEKYEQLKIEQDEWSNKLFTTCNQKVTWI